MSYLYVLVLVAFVLSVWAVLTEASRASMVPRSVYEPVATRVAVQATLLALSPRTLGPACYLGTRPTGCP